MQTCTAQGSLLSCAHRRTLHRLIRWETGRVAISLELIVELVCAGLDGHARAVEALWEEHSPPAQPVVGACKLQLHTYRKPSGAAGTAQHCCRALCH